MTYCEFMEVESGWLQCRFCKRKWPKPATMPLTVLCHVERDAKPRLPGGAGTELGKLLKKFGIRATPGCGCEAREKLMDAMGVAWVESNLDKLADELVAEAKKRGWIWAPKWGARRVIERAVRNAKRKQPRN